MKLPFVSRTYHEERVADLKAVIAMCDEDLKEGREERRDLQGRYDALLDRFDTLVRASLKPQGVHVAEPPGAAIQRPVVKQDPLILLIDEQCGRDVAKRAMMLRQLTVDRAAGVKDEDIEHSIRTGVTSDGVPG